MAMPSMRCWKRLTISPWQLIRGSRASGEYIIHPFHADILVDLGLDAPVIARPAPRRGGGHPGYPRAAPEKEFGDEICMLVDGVTQAGEDKFPPRRKKSRPKTSGRCSSLWQRISASSSSSSQNRLDNMRSLSYLDDEAASMARETLTFTPHSGQAGKYPTSVRA